MKTIIIGTSKFGSPVTDYYRNLGDCFRKHNYRVVYIFDGFFTDYPEESENLKFYTWKNKRPTKFADFSLFREILKKEKPVLCISNFGSTNIITLASYLLKVKNIISYIHTTSKAIKADAKRNVIIYNILYYRKRFIYNLNTHIFTNSNGTKKDTIDHYHIKEKKITVFPLLVKNSPLKYRSFQEREKSICIVGRLNPVKGHKELIRVFQKSLTQHPDLILKIVGDGYLKQELIDLTKELQIENNVIFTGSIPNSEINNIFSSSLICISSSVDEAYGLTLIEALREGTPLICTQTAGSLDIVEDGINGLFFTLNDPLSFSAAIEKVLKNWEHFSKNSLEIFKQKYNLEYIENHFNKMESIIS